MYRYALGLAVCYLISTLQWPRATTQSNKGSTEAINCLQAA